MEWLQAFMIAGSTLGACYVMHKENFKLNQERNAEMKDFHGRLCTLEQRYINMMEKLMEIKTK